MIKILCIFVVLLAGCSTPSKQTVEIGKAYDLEECLTKECDLGCDDETLPPPDPKTIIRR